MVTRFIATPYFVVLTLLLRLHQSAFSHEQLIATLSAKTLNFAMNKVLAYRDRRGIARASLALAVSLLTACASEKLALAPSAGVNFSGTWQLNKADSDDPQLLQNQSNPARAKASDPPLCGWSAKTLIVLDSEDVRLRVEQDYGISEDGQRLVEVVGVKGHMDGFTMSRVWDRAP